MTNSNPEEHKYFFQYVVAFFVTLLHLSSGIVMGWSSPSLSKLATNDSPIPITNDEGSWLAVIIIIGQLVSIFPIFWMMDKFGRKITLIAGGVPMIVGWILIGCADSIIYLYAGRFLHGLTVGVTFLVLPYYLAEIASDKIRGFLTTMFSVMMQLGVLYVYAIGPYVQVSTMSWLALIPVIVFIVAFIWLPESPYYLLQNKQNKEAHESLTRLRGHSNVDNELCRMDASVQKSNQQTGTFMELFSPRYRQSMIIMSDLIGILNLSGSLAILSYAEPIFNRIDSGLKGSEASIVLAVVQLTSSILPCFIVDVIGRKPLLLVSVVGVAITNTIVAVFFCMERWQINVSTIGWIPVAALMLYMISFNVELACVPFVIGAEIFPTHLKVWAGCSTTVLAAVIGFIVGKMFQVISDGVGIDVSFGIFATFSYLFIPFILFAVPETKGKSFEVILEELRVKGIFAHYGSGR